MVQTVFFQKKISKRKKIKILKSKKEEKILDICDFCITFALFFCGIRLF